jgi:putative sodium extrusion ABC transporter, permease protein
MNNLLNVLKKELREMFRDKKTMSLMLIVPFMIPLLVLGMSYLFDSEVNQKQDEYKKIGFSYKLSSEEKEIAKNLKIKIYEDNIDSLKKKYENEKIDLYVVKKDDTYIMMGNDNERTSYATSVMDVYFQTFKEYLERKNLTSLGIDNNILEPFKVKTKISKTENYFSNYITTYAFLFIIMAITVSSTYPATDTTAGEKERGTLETLLTFPIKSRDIILGKFLGVSISSIITGMISLILTIISLYIANNSFELYKDVNLMLPVSAYIFVSIIIVAYSLLISGLCIAIASKAKSFKEAQSALTPLTFITFFPGMIALIMNIKLTPVLSLIPFLNYNLIFQDIINNKYDIVNILCMFISTVVVIGIVLKIIIKQYKSERVLFE